MKIAGKRGGRGSAWWRPHDIFGRVSWTLLNATLWPTRYLEDDQILIMHVKTTIPYLDFLDNQKIIFFVIKIGLNFRVNLTHFQK